jgi:sugar diacid utilization regulator
MTTLAKLMDAPSLNRLLTYVARPRSDPLVERVALIEDLAELAEVGEHAIVLLTRVASASAGSYRFDTALRLARARSVAALVLSSGTVGNITPTSAAVADRSATAILATGSDVDLADLAIVTARELAGGADVTMRRAHAALRAIEPSRDDRAPEALVKRAADELGVPLRLLAADPKAGPRVAIRVDDHIETWLTAPPQEGSLALALDIVLYAAATRIGSLLSSARRAEELPIQSREEVLTELLSAPPQERARLVQRARTLGMPIDGWHVVVRIDFEDLADRPARDELAVYDERIRFARTILQSVRSTGGEWHRARAGPSVLLIRIQKDDPGVGAASKVAGIMDHVLSRVRSRITATLIRSGVGTAHIGPSGLVASATEARAAATVARTTGRVNTTVPFDSVGLRRTLIEWYASDTAQEAVLTVLAPLLRLNAARGERLIQTLHVYLDQHCSLTRTAELLNLHRNAVRYRIDQAFEILEIDPDNSDDLLLLQLACRARELGIGVPV